jgi:hypothetical protein
VLPTVKLPKFRPQAPPLGWSAQAERVLHTELRQVHVLPSGGGVAAGQGAPCYGHHRGHSHSAARRDFEGQASRPLDERLDKLFTMTKMIGRKPAAMLAAMLEVCPRREKNSSHLYKTMIIVFDIKHRLFYIFKSVL